MEQKKKKIIYVFGPKRLHDKYMRGEPLNLEINFGYVKIGETICPYAEDKWAAAYARVKNESKTGIPETCRLYDVYEYPFIDGITSCRLDDKLRRILTKDMYYLENSKDNNSITQKKDYEINAGMEFVYGVTRKQVNNAVAKLERDLIIEVERTMPDLTKCLLGKVQKNIEDTQEEDIEIVSTTSSNNYKSELGDEFWISVKNKLGQMCTETQCKVITYYGRPYITINKDQKWQFTASYSVRYYTISVSFEIYGGEEMCEQVEKYISTHPDDMVYVSHELSSAIQGSRNKEKWYWKLTDSLEKTQPELIDWFVKNIINMLRAFSDLSFIAENNIDKNNNRNV